MGYYSLEKIAIFLLASLLAINGLALFAKYNSLKAPFPDQVIAVHYVKGRRRCEILCLEYGTHCQAVSLLYIGGNSYNCEIFASLTAPALLENNPRGSFLGKNGKSFKHLIILVH